MKNLNITKAGLAGLSQTYSFNASDCLNGIKDDGEYYSYKEEFLCY